MKPAVRPSVPTSTRPALAVRVRRTTLAAASFGLLGALLYLEAVPCTFARVFHTPCPGCGSTRAVVALLNADLGGVVRYNALGAVLALLLGVLGAQALGSVFSHGDFRGAGGGRLGLIVKRVIVVVAVLETIVWVARFFGALGGPVPV